MKKAFMLYMALTLLGIGQAWSASPITAKEIPAKNGDSVGAYINTRYGFAVNWLPGAFTITESENGDGITVADPKRGMELRAWGSTGWSTLGMDFEAGVQDTCGWFDEVLLKRVNAEEGWFVLSGYAKNNVLHVKGYYTPDDVNILSIRYAQKDKNIFDDFAAGALRSFRILKPQSESAPPSAGLSLVTVRADSGIDEHGCNSFLLTAQENMDILFRKAVLDEKNYVVLPGDMIKKVTLKAGEACLLRTTVPEGLPNVVVCVQDTRWIPSFSGEDGSLVLAPGFAPSSVNEPCAAQVAEIHLVLSDSFMIIDLADAH